MTDSLYSDNKIETVLITGGTGSFGSAMTACLIALPNGPRVRVYSRDEDKQENMARRLPPGPRLTYILGDVRDVAQLTSAADGCDAIIHSAALKRVPQGERHASEFVKTNVDGTANVIRAAISASVRRNLFISSDKAVNPSVNFYGKTKSIAESLFIQANAQGVSRSCKFSVVRGGNVWGSRGSVVEKWRTVVECDESLVVTGEHNTRFHLAMDDWTSFCWRVLNDMHGGEIFIPKCRAWRVMDLARAFSTREIVVEPSRNGDKVHESFLALGEGGRTVETDWACIIEPSPDLREVWNYQKWAGRRWMEAAYTSETVDKLSVYELRELIHGH